MVISFAKDGRLRDASRKRYSSKRGVRRGVYLSELNCLLELFPNDWRVPAIKSLFDPGRLARMLASAGLEESHIRSVGYPPRVISYRPHESCVVVYDTADREFPPRVVAKVSAKAERMAKFHRASRLLRDSMLGPEVWTPQTYRPRRQPGVLFMDYAPGTAVFDSESPTESIRLAAVALAAMHSIALPSRVTRGSSISDHLKHVRARTARAHLAAPGFAERATEVLDEAEQVLPRESALRVLLHGDYKGTQILVHDGRAAIIDLDSVTVGDPALDLGNFLADIRREGVSRERPDFLALENHFLETYLSHSANTDVQSRSRVIQAIELIGMGVHRFRQTANLYTVPALFSPLALFSEAENCLKLR